MLYQFNKTCFHIIALYTTFYCNVLIKIVNSWFDHLIHLITELLGLKFNF